MKHVNASEFRERFEEYWDLALHEPIAITKDDIMHLVVISYEEFKDLRAKAGVQQSFSVSELSEDDIKLISESKMPPGFEHLNEEMEDSEPQEKDRDPEK